MYILKLSQVFSIADQGLEKVVSNVAKYMLLKNIQICCSNLLNFVYIVVSDDETALENAKFVIWKFPT